MAELFYTQLPARGVIEITGEDRVPFLQGLVSNDVAKAAPGRAIYAALLTAQGRYLFDFFIIAKGDALYLDAEAARLADLQRRLAIYKLRAKAALSDASARFAVAAAWGDGTPQALGLAGDTGAAKEFAGGVAYLDPRLVALGARFLLPCEKSDAPAQAGFAASDAAAYDRHRLALGVPDGTRDLAPEKALLMEAGFDELNGIDWQKGCYMGQELTARMRYRGLVKKRLLPVAIEGGDVAPGTAITQEGSEAGEMLSGRDGRGLALLRLEAVEAAQKSGADLKAGAAIIRPQKPDWLKD
ncbi:MAG TPA: folate-binding protein [Stellaceae bacterium]|jgi:folate-binding protein YgfZ|nr:folate-binding protein [Stellaceae bacterium]